MQDCLVWHALEDAAEKLEVSDRQLRKACNAHRPMAFRNAHGRREVQLGAAYHWLSGNARCPRLRKPAGFDQWLDAYRAGTVPSEAPAIAPASAIPAEPQSAGLMDRLDKIVIEKFKGLPLPAAYQASRQAIEAEVQRLREAGHSEDDAAEWYECLKWVSLEDAAKVLDVSVRVLRKHTMPEAVPILPNRTDGHGRKIQPGAAYEWLCDNTRLGGSGPYGDPAAWKAPLVKEPPGHEEWEEAKVFVPPGYFENEDSTPERPLREMLYRKLQLFPALPGLLEVLRFIDCRLAWIKENAERRRFHDAAFVP